MRRNRTKMAFAAMFAIPLGACSSFHGPHLFGHSADASGPMRSTQTTSVDYAPLIYPATQAGRDLLAKGMPGSAIESFQRALSAGEPVAPAINGLGIAYARLGRFDLAKIFFERAIAVDPGNDRYQDNLTLLLASPQYALDQHASCAATPIPAGQSSTLAENGRKAGMAAVATPGKLQRISRNEVYIVTAPALRAPILASAGVFGSHAKAGKRVALNAPELQHFAPVVRLDLPKANSGTAYFPGTKPQAPVASSASRTVIFPTMVAKRVALNGAEIRHFVPVVHVGRTDAISVIEHSFGTRFQSLAVADR